MHVIPRVGEEDPVLISFCEEPEDPRVYLPAHRIGDVLPEAAMNSPPKRPTVTAGGAAARSPQKNGAGISKSMTTLHIAASRLPLRPVKGGCWIQGNAGHGGAGGTVAKLLRREEDVFDDEGPTPASAVLDDPVFPEPPRNSGGAGADDDDEEYLPD